MAGFTIDRLSVNGTDDMHVPQVHRRSLGNVILITGSGLNDVQLSSVTFFPPEILDVFGISAGGAGNHNDHLGIWKFQVKLKVLLPLVPPFPLGMIVTFELDDLCQKTLMFPVIVERR